MIILAFSNTFFCLRLTKHTQCLPSTFHRGSSGYPLGKVHFLVFDLEGGDFAPIFTSVSIWVE